MNEPTTASSWLPLKRLLLPDQTPNFDMSDYGTVNCAICARYKQESRILILISDYAKYKHLHDWPMCNRCLHTAAMRTATEPPKFHYPAGLTTYLNRVSNNDVSIHTEFFDRMTKAQQNQSTKTPWTSPEYGQGQEYDQVQEYGQNQEYDQEQEYVQRQSPMYSMTRHELLMERSRHIEEKEEHTKNVVNANASVIKQWMSQQPIEQDPVKYAEMIARLFEGKEMKRETNIEYDLAEIEYYLEGLRKVGL